MNESEQAQAIQRWSHSNYEEMTLYDDGTWVTYDDHKAIVDSQAQKIADLNRVGSNTLLALKESQEKIAEQAKEIEMMKCCDPDAEPESTPYHESPNYYFNSAQWRCRICKGHRRFSSEGYRFHLADKHNITTKGKTWQKRFEWLKNFQTEGTV